MKTLVLGSGPSALAYLFYNPDAFALAGDQVGGLFAQQAGLGPQLLWHDKLAQNLMEDLGLPITTRQVKVGYIYRRTLLPREAMTDSEFEDFRNVYSLRTRGTKPIASHLSGGRSSFLAFTTPVDRIVQELAKQVALRLILGKAVFVDLYSRTVGSNQESTYLHYEKLVSTVPAPVLLSLIGHQDKIGQLSARDKTYLEVQTSALPRWARDAVELGFDYVYVVDEECTTPYHRVKFLGGEGGTAILEDTIQPGQTPPSSARLHRAGQIIGGSELLRSLPTYIETLGRYASWNHGIKLNQVLEIIAHGN